MMWKLFQATIFFGFITWNIASPWTPNPLVPALIGAITAHIVTELCVKLSDWSRRLFARTVLVSRPADNQIGNDGLCPLAPRVEFSDLLQLGDRVR
jgi:hypothetical protein